MQNLQAESLFQPADLAQAIESTMDEEGRCVGRLYGCVMGIPHHTVARVIAPLGFDFVLIDALHSPIYPENLISLIQAIHFMSRGETVAVVRVPSEGSDLVTHALDAGAAGIIFPHVKSPEQAAEGVRKCRYARSGGERSLSPWALLSGITDAAPPGLDAEMVADRHVAVICQIEDTSGVENVEAIATTPGVNALMVGPSDLRLSLGLSTKPVDATDDPCYERAVRRVAAAASRYRKPLVSLAPKLSSSPQGDLMIQHSGLLLTGGDLWGVVKELRSGLDAIKARLETADGVEGLKGSNGES